MPQNEKEKIIAFIKELDYSLNERQTNKRYQFDREVRDWHEITKKQYEYDIVIRDKNQPVAVVEFRSDYILNPSFLEKLKSIPINVRFILLTNGQDILVLDRQKDEILDQKINIQALLYLFLDRPSKSKIEEFKREFAHSFFTFLTQYHPDKFHEKSEVKAELNITFDEILENLEFNVEKNLLSFKSGKSFDLIEGKIFNFLLPDLKYKQRQDKQSIYRYTTLDTMHNIIKSGKYRINGVRGMNDPSDGIFMDKLISPYANYEDQDVVEDLNKKFISSCSLKRDDLTMWRLYGDNSKGVCIELETEKTEANSDFFIKRIVYMKNEREAIITLFTNVFDYFITRGITFKFKWWDAFKLFFKSKDYAVESEVRILFVNDQNKQRDWTIAQPYGIVNPFVEFNLLSDGGFGDEKIANPELPFRIKKIILGPNCPYKDKNIGQLRDLLKEKKFQGVGTALSRIQNDTYIA